MVSVQPHPKPDSGPQLSSLSPPTASNRQVASALGALERMGLIHADIHAKNIMLVDHRAEPLAVKLIDFGTAVRSSDPEPTMSHQIYSYRSPEIILGLRVSAATDVWSLGVVMGLMVCDQQLFPGHGSYEVVSSHIQCWDVGLLRCSSVSSRGLLKLYSLHLSCSDVSVLLLTSQHTCCFCCFGPFHNLHCLTLT